MDLVTNLLEVLNHQEINLNISYDNLMNCSLSELVYWQNRANELVLRVEERRKNEKGD